MIHHVKGNLLTDYDLPAIAHQCNCQNTMGAGIAKSIKDMYPEAYAADTKAYKEGRAKLGNISVGISKEGTDKQKIIINIYGQHLYGRSRRQTNYEALNNGIEKARLFIESCDIKKIGFPARIGCNLAGGNWKIVQTILEENFSDFDGDMFIVDYSS